MTHEKEDRLDRLERIVSEYIEESREDRKESQADRKEMRRTNQLLVNATQELINLQLQYHRDAINPAQSPSAGD